MLQDYDISDVEGSDGSKRTDRMTSSVIQLQGKHAELIVTSWPWSLPFVATAPTRRRYAWANYQARSFNWLHAVRNKTLSYRRETALQDALVLAKSGRLKLGDSILRIFNHCDIMGLQSYRIL